MHNKGNCERAHRAVQDTLAVVNGKWKFVILSILIDGKKKFGELAREADISPRMLSKELHELELNQLVERRVCATKPVTVEYSATEYCQTLREVITAMSKWGLQHRERIMARS